MFQQSIRYSKSKGNAEFNRQIQSMQNNQRISCILMYILVFARSSIMFLSFTERWCQLPIICDKLDKLIVFNWCLFQSRHVYSYESKAKMQLSESKQLSPLSSSVLTPGSSKCQAWVCHRQTLPLLKDVFKIPQNLKWSVFQQPISLVLKRVLNTWTLYFSIISIISPCSSKFVILLNSFDYNCLD